MQEFHSNYSDKHDETVRCCYRWMMWIFYKDKLEKSHVYLEDYFEALTDFILKNLAI